MRSRITSICGARPSSPGSRSRGGLAPLARVIVPDDKGLGQRLSFQNLVEVHVLSSLRAYYIPRPRVREAIGFMRDLFATDQPLPDIQIHADRAETFVKYFSAIVTVLRGGQTTLGPVVEH